MILFVDLETNKLFRQDLTANDRAQPWLIDMAAILCTPEGDAVDFLKRRIRLPGDAGVQAGAEAVHGISARAARRAGASQRWAIFGLIELMNDATEAACYGDFDRKIVCSLIERLAGNETDAWLRRWNRPPGTVWHDLILQSTHACKIPSTHEMGGWRWPSLDQACEAVLGMPPRGQKHDAWDDVTRCRALYFALKGKDVLEVVV